MLKRITLQNFRNLASVDLCLHPGVTVVSGRNGHGKTNLLEAIHWVTQGWSFRTRKFDSAVRMGTDEAWLRMEGTAHNGRAHQQGILWRSGDIAVKVNGEEVKGLAALHGHLYAIMLGPDDIELIKEGPEKRRRWLDILLAERFADGLDTLMRYRRVLAQRNRLLKDWRAAQVPPSSADIAVLDTLSEQLAQLGAKITLYRAQLVHELSPAVSAYYTQLSNAAEAIGITYRSSVVVDLSDSTCDEVFLTGKLLRKLTAMRGIELSQGSTAAGPHKDDLELRFVQNGALLREVGSQGQCRTAALSMGLVALDVALSLDAEPPLLLLDDIFAELDTGRRTALANLIRTKACQVLIATPRAEDLPFAGDHFIVLENGVASPRMQ